MGFSRLLKPSAPEQTFRLPLDIDDSRGQPALILKFGGPGNDAYVNAMYQRAPLPGKASADRDRLDRELDAPVLAETCVAGWEHIYEDNATDVAPFSAAKATEFLLELARERPTLFDTVRRATRTEVLFRGPVDGGDLGKG